MKLEVINNETLEIIDIHCKNMSEAERFINAICFIIDDDKKLDEKFSIKLITGKGYKFTF